MKKLLLFLFISIGMLQYANAQTVTGLVTGSDDGQPLPGVNIQIKGTSNGTITDLEGKYTIDVAGEAPVLIFSFIGYTAKEVAVDGQTNIDVQLDVESTGIEEIIITGYGVQKKSLVTGSIAKVDGSEIARNPNLQVNQALQGKTAGVLITNNSGQPGSFVSVRIRGNGTNGDAEPLYIVDGLPMDGGGIDFINPSDVESVEVLKDAASASIYGARGANGVVLITTKTGNRNDKFQISYDGYYGVQNPWRKLDVLNKDEYVMIMNEASLNAGQGVFFDQARIDTLANTDWQDEMFFYNAPKMNHVLSFTGGSEKTTYSSSLSYYGQDGIVAEGQSNYKRITYRLNVTRKFGMLEVGSNLNFANIQTKGIAANDKYAGNSLIQALNTPPIVPIYNADGTFATPTEYGVGIQEITNPLAVLSYQNNETKTNKGIGNVYADFDFGDLFAGLKGLKFRTSFGGEIAYVGNRGYTPKYYIDNLHQSTASTVSSGMDKYGRWNFENVL
ncbi:MAG: SusC/RagA family TonB-linked outer membrane protein, partial [Bacteroidales bacterium]|nr:SusC/RagA family TonB-linked outer membrane protein [Bacteroidales bacterium]